MKLNAREFVEKLTTPALEDYFQEMVYMYGDDRKLTPRRGAWIRQNYHDHINEEGWHRFELLLEQEIKRRNEILRALR